MRPLRLVFTILLFAGSVYAANADVITVHLDLDATQAPTGMLHAHLTIPATAGPLTLAYPKWIPGEHAPSGPLSQVVKFSVYGEWKADYLAPRRSGCLSVPRRCAAGLSADRSRSRLCLRDRGGRFPV